MPPKYPLPQLITKMDDVHASVANNILNDYADTIYAIPGSTHNHQAWEGGYIAHIEEAMNIGLILYQQLAQLRPLEFSLSTALFCIFIHDFDKLHRYGAVNGKIVIKSSDKDDYLEIIKNELEINYSYELSGGEYNALKYAHGEGDDYSSSKRTMSPLATLVHCADIISARIWFDYGKISNSW